MPTTEWLNKYEAIKNKLTCKDDLEAHFTEKVIGNMAVYVLDIGAVHFPTGQIFACDPLVEELNAHVWGEEFHACVIEQAEFEAAWESHTYDGALK